MTHFLNIHEVYLGYDSLLDGERYRTLWNNVWQGVLVNEIPECVTISTISAPRTDEKTKTEKQ